MSLISNKILKRVAALLLCVCVLFCATACTKNTKNIKDVDQICVSGALYESWMHVYTDEEFVSEMVDIFNNLQYEKTEQSVNMMTAGEVLSFTFSKGNEQKATFIVDKNGVFAFEAGDKSYKIVSDFDFSYVYDLVESQKDTDDTAATDDEV